MEQLNEDGEVHRISTHELSVFDCEVVRLTLVSIFSLEWVIAIEPHYMFLLFEAASLG